MDLVRDSVGRETGVGSAETANRAAFEELLLTNGGIGLLMATPVMESREKVFNGLLIRPKVSTQD